MIRKTNIAIGKRIRELRKQRNLTQEELGLEFGERSFISRVETGKRSLNIRSIDNLCTIFDISIFEFFNSPLLQ
jgi:transcriptional regulator with XRE-family HTH domain